VQAERLLDIESKMKQKEELLEAPDKFRDKKRISRQQMDLERSLFQGTQRDANTLSHLLTSHSEKDIVGDPDDPVNHIPELLAEMEESSRQKILELRRMRRRKKRKGLGLNYLPETEGGEKSNDEDDEGEVTVAGCVTYEEMRVLGLVASPPQPSLKQHDNADPDSLASGDGPNTQNSSKKQKKQKDMATSFVYLGGNKELQEGYGTTQERNQEDCASKVIQSPVEFVDLEFIQRNRLSKEDIHKLPRFENYEPGQPNNVSVYMCACMCVSFM
jgi:hypothetical protein